MRSPRGQRLKVLLDALRTLEQEKVPSVAISLIVTVNDCLGSGGGCKLPSAVDLQSSVWSAFSYVPVKARTPGTPSSQSTSLELHFIHGQRTVVLSTCNFFLKQRMELFDELPLCGVLQWM